MTEHPIRHRRREPLSYAFWETLFRLLAVVVMAAFVLFLIWTLTSQVFWFQLVGAIVGVVFFIGALLLVLYAIAYDRTR